MTDHDGVGAPCPACGQPFPKTDVVSGLTVCPTCQKTVHVAEWRRARAAETVGLSAEDLTALRRARGRKREAAYARA